MSGKSERIALVDYGMGNLRSVARAFERVGREVRLSPRAEDVRAADRVVLPGVGSARDTMAALAAHGLDDALRAHIAAGRPYLGICLGLQVLLDEADEGGVGPCLGVIPGRVERFPDSLDLAVPHMGWNLVKLERPHPVLAEDYYYFVHSYRATRVGPQHTLARTDYGEKFASAIGRDSCVAVQYHPEKSQRAGLELLERFCAWRP
ncbi:MAG TPA: imidazole glycerol phosphate synthase subunit HisH [Myxococcota bacterium]|nr:imidazole glycerol phosphate synthase subunit HisH [Myxococcota bacterium]